MSASIIFSVPEQTDPAIFAIRSALLPGQSSPTLSFQQWGCGITLGGACHYRLGKDELFLEAGDVTLVRSGTDITWKVHGDKPWRVVYAMFYPRLHWHPWLAALDLKDGYLRAKIDDSSVLSQLRRGLLEMHRTYTRTLIHRDEWTLLALERVLLTLHTYLAGEKSALDARVLEAVRFMHEHYAEPLTNQDIARAAHSSVSHLTFLFARQMNVAPMQYLEQLRLQCAAEMLQFTSVSVAQVMTGSGYRDVAYFSNRFRRYSGQSPRAFRASKRRGDKASGS